MVKADPRRNYYADLDLDPSATTEDIKAQFRKLARIYHPDRNPGKEIEFVPKFQSIQAANEILGDPDQRAKYDADRRRLGYNIGHRGAPGQRPAFNYRHTTRPSSRYDPLFNPAQPPPQAPQPPRPGYYSTKQPTGYPPQSAYEAAGRTRPTPFGSRYTATSAGTTPNKPDAEGRAKAWQQFGPSSATGSFGKPTDSPRRPRPGPYSEKASTASPGLNRSNTTRTPRRSGFDPNLPGAEWEPAAPKSSAYVFARPRASSMEDLDVDGAAPTSRRSTARARSASPKNGEKKKKTPEKSKASFQYPSDSPLSDSSSSSGVPLAHVSPKKRSPKRTQEHEKLGPKPGDNFLASAWTGITSDAFAAPPSDNLRRSSRARVSPSRPIPRAKETTKVPSAGIPQSNVFAASHANVPTSTPSTASSAPSTQSGVQSGPQTDTSISGKSFTEQWAPKFKDASFVFPANPPTAGPTTRAASLSAKGSSRTRSTSQTKETTSSANMNLDGATQEPTPRESESSTPEEDLMDLDTPPKPARKVKVPVSKSEWRDPKPATSQPSEVPFSGHTQPPSTVPNAVPPPPPPLDPATVHPPTATTPGRNTSASSTTYQPQSNPSFEEPVPPFLNLSSLKDNLSTSGVGIANLSDLNASLPFQSRPSNIHPHTTLHSLSPMAPFEITNAPAAPLPPTKTRRLTAAQFKQYAAQMSVYMGAWHKWEGRIIQHFQKRHADAAKFGTGVPDNSATRLLEATGEPEGGGIGAYLEGRKQDKTLRDKWNVASLRHEKCIEDFEWTKMRIRNEGLAMG